jgi:hypothetical protein
MEKTNSSNPNTRNNSNSNNSKRKRDSKIDSESEIELDDIFIEFDEETLDSFNSLEFQFEKRSDDKRPILAKKPHERLQSFEIVDAVNHFASNRKKFYFYQGTIPAGSIPNIKKGIQKAKTSGKTQFGFVFNTSDAASLGSHWTGLFVEAKPDFLLAEYFDSFGRNYDLNKPLELTIQNILSTFKTAFETENIIEYYHSSKKQHGVIQCGIFVVWFLDQKSQGLDFDYVERAKVNDDTCVNYRRYYWK